MTKDKSNGRSENRIDRRRLIAATALGATGLASAGLMPSAWADDKKPGLEDKSIQDNREALESFARSFYEAKDSLEYEPYFAHFTNPYLFTDATFIGLCPTPRPIPTSAPPMLAKIGTPGRFAKFIHVTGDMRWGAVAEFVDVPGTFFGVGFDAMSVWDFTGNLISRSIDYWDSMQLTQADISGTGATVGKGDFLLASGPMRDVPVAFNLAPVHPGGAPLQKPACTYPTPNTDMSHASPEWREWALRFNDAMQGGVGQVTKLLTEDCVLIHPLLHTGVPGYPTFHRSIQIRGIRGIERFLEATIDWLPDAQKPRLISAVGGPSGGGFEWKSGGKYSQQGLSRDGIQGATAIDVFDNQKISRISVRFDTYQMTAPQREAVQKAVLAQR